MSKKARSKKQLGNLSVSIYQGYALIQGSYPVRLAKGVNQFQLEGFPTSFVPESEHVESFDGPGPVTLKSTTFRPANLNPSTLQSRALNQKVTVRYTNSGEEGEREIKGFLLNLYGDTAVLKVKGGKIREVRGVTGFDYKSVPEGLANTASLSMTVEAEEAGDYMVHLFYKANSFSWRADYKLIYNEAKGCVDWDASVFARNGSGANFADAMLRVVAGDAGQEANASHLEAMDAMPMAAMAPAGGRSAKRVHNAQVESAGQVKPYKVGKATLEDGDNQKIPFFVSGAVPVKRECRVGKMRGWHARGGDKIEQDVRNVFIFQNTTDARLGMPLPGGTVSVMHRGEDGTLLKSGGGRLQDTAVAEEINLDIGADFDLRASRKVADVSKEKGPKLVRKHAKPGREDDTPDQQKVFYDKQCHVELFNGKSCAVEVVVEESLDRDCEFHGDHGLTKNGPSDYSTRVTLQPGEKKVICYTIRQTTVEQVEEEAAE